MHLGQLVPDRFGKLVHLLLHVLPKLVQLSLALLEVFLEVEEVLSEFFLLAFAPLQAILQSFVDFLRQLVVFVVLLYRVLLNLYSNLVLRSLYPLLHPQGQVLQSLAALVEDRLAFPVMDVLRYHGIAQNLKQFLQRARNVVPVLHVQKFSKRVFLYILANVALLVVVVVVVGCAHVTVVR